MPSNGYLEDQRDAHAEILEAGAWAKLTWDVNVPPTVAQIKSGEPGTKATGSGRVAITVLPLSKRFMAADTYAALSLQFTNSRRFFMSAYKVPIEVITGMKIIGWEGEDWTIDSIAALRPDGVTAIFYSGTAKR